jgi:AcrR family transcriptional regulator
MRTRDRILEAGLKLFNADGVARVSTSRIATEVEISPGNLHYHFKTKEEIVEWLVRRLEGRIDPLLDDDAPMGAIDDWWLHVHLSLEAIYDYRFVFYDLDYLLREYPRVATRIRRLTLHSLQSVRRQCGELARSGVMRASDEDLEMLALHIVFTGTCWLTFANVLPDPARSQPPSGLAAYQVLSLLGPYLADEPAHYLHYLKSKYVR